MGFAADAVNPLLALSLLAASFRAPPVRGRARFWLRTALAVGAVYLALALDRRFAIWPGAGLDFSTHTGLAVALGVSLVALDRRWAWLVAPLLAAYAWLMIHLGYHSLADIATTAVLIAPLAAACHLVRR